MLIACIIGFAVIWLLSHLYGKWKDHVFGLGYQSAMQSLKSENEALGRRKAALTKAERDLQIKTDQAERDIQQKERRMLDGVERHKRVEELTLNLYREKVNKAQHIEELIAKERQLISKLADDVLAVVPYAAEIVADYMHAHDVMIADLLESKARPALKAAEQVRECAKARREAEKNLRLCMYRLSVFEHFFPWISDYENLTISDLCKVTSDESSSDDPIDPVKQYITPEEYLSLNDIQRNQLALDRYLASHKKAKWEIGRDYELFVGHLFARDGYHVEYTGSLFRFDDLGRDLIVRKSKRILIVQCKYWSKDKEIHEKHIFQLFGTTICYQMEHPDCQVSCVLVTNTVCSEVARSFAARMNVALKENVDLDEFPRIKCNISDTGERIYHLPMDQQYDNVVIDKHGEFFARTVQEAANRGFRRAYRWHGN